MAALKTRFNDLISSLKERDFRPTPSAAQHYAKIKTQFSTMSHATVYMILALLKDMNQVLAIDLRDHSHHDGNRPEPHPHLICIKCNKITDGDSDFDPAAIWKPEQASGYKILRSQVSFYGLCPDCKQSSQWALVFLHTI